MSRRHTLAALVLAGGVGLAQPVLAHHSFAAEFDFLHVISSNRARSLLYRTKPIQAVYFRITICGCCVLSLDPNQRQGRRIG